MHRLETSHRILGRQKGVHLRVGQWEGQLCLLVVSSSHLFLFCLPPPPPPSFWTVSCYVALIAQYLHYSPG